MNKKLSYRLLSLALTCACVSISAACGEKQSGLQYGAVSASALKTSDNPDGTVTAYYYSTARPQWISVVSGGSLKNISKKYTPKGDYYKLTAERTEMIGLWIKPARELNYYIEMKEQGYTGISFDYWAKQTRQENTFKPDGTMGPTYNGIDMVCYDGTQNTTPRIGEWATVTMSIDTIIRNYDLLCAGTYNPTTDGKEGYKKALTFTVIDWHPNPMEVYVGNFRSVKNA
jgi:hypothetical protein